MIIAKPLLVTVFIAVSLVAQASAGPPDSLWMRSYGGSTGEQIRCISQTADSGFVFSGSVWIEEFGGHSDVYVGRLDSEGDTLWTTRFGGFASDVGYAVRETQDGGYVVAGYYSYVDDPNNRDVYLVKLDSSGGIEWQKTFGGSGFDEANDVQVLVGDGGFLIAGYTRSFGVYGSDVYLVRTYSNGDTIATRHHDFSINDCAKSIHETTDGYVLCGHTQSPTDYDLLLMKTTSHLDYVWSKGYGGAGDDIAYSIRLTPVDFGFILGGQTSSFGAGGADGWALKTDLYGDTLWTRTIGDSLYNRFFAVDVTDDSGYVFGGQYGSVPLEGRKFYAAKLDAGGALEWEGTYGVPDNECVALSMEQTPDGGYVMGGYVKWAASGDMDGLVVKLGSATESGIEQLPVVTGRNPVAYPNPSSDRVRIVFTTEERCRTECRIYDLGGRLVGHSESPMLGPGRQTLAWDGTGLDGRAAPPGVYFYHLTIGKRDATGRLVLTE